MTKRKPADQIQKAGRPTAYRIDYARQAAQLCNLGATDVELADFFQVDIATIYRWKHNHPAFCEALKLGKNAADERVEKSLYSKATGYTFDAEEVFQHQGQIIRAPVRKHVPPSDTAIIFWLKNRKRAEWQDAQVHEHKLPTAAETAKAMKDMDGEL